MDCLGTAAGWVVAGNLTNTATRGLDALDIYFSRYLPQLVLSAIIPLAIGVAILTQDILSAVVVALTVPLIPFFMALVGWVTQSKVDKQWHSMQALSGHFLDLVSGLPTLKAFNRSRFQAKTIKAVGNAALNSAQSFKEGDVKGGLTNLAQGGASYLGSKAGLAGKVGKALGGI
jgi:ATP-binding cassette subfamily C protein CydCD